MNQLFDRLADLRQCTLVLVVVVFGIAVSTIPARAADPGKWVQKHLDELVDLYKYLHQHPELSFQEQQTAERIAQELRKTGAEVTEHVGGHGVVAVLRNGAGPTLLLRADMDALPVAELTGLQYASTVRAKHDHETTVGVMHACGHDIHMVNLIGTARYLAEHRDQWQGTLVMIGQPAEERGAGAKAMLADGLFKRFPRPDFALAVHVDPSLPTGKISYRGGYTQANVDSVDINIVGRGGHGAYPHTTIDPIVIAARLVLDLQTIVSREMKPTDPVVVTIGAIHGGTKHNIIADTCQLQLTVRTYSDETRQRVHEAIRRKASAATAGAGAPEPEIKIGEGTPAVKNDEALAQRLAAVFEQTLGKENVQLAEPSMGGEDFGRYGREGVPILMYQIGSVSAERLAGYQAQKISPPSLHSARFYPDPQPTLTTGVVTMVAAALELLGTETDD